MSKGKQKDSRNHHKRPTAPAGFVLFVAAALVAWGLVKPAKGGHETRWTVFIVAGRSGAVPSRRPVEALLGEKVDLYPVVARRRGGTTTYFSQAKAFRSGGTRLACVPFGRLSSGKPRGSGSSLGFRWYQVEPYGQHKKLKSPNKGDPTYANAVLMGPRHGKWLGFDRLEYFESPIKGAKKARWTVTKASPSKHRSGRGAGTMRYKVSVRIKGRWLSSPGVQAVGSRGIKKSVIRVSFRHKDDFVGHVSSYFNVPYVFGSAGSEARHQTDLYTGTDCADVLVGGARRAGAKVPYTSAAGLKRYTTRVSSPLLMTRQGFFVYDGGKKGKRARLRFGREVKRGDMMLINYVGFNGTPRGWDHVGVLVADQGVKGRLDPKDSFYHMGLRNGLLEAAVGSEGPAVVQFLRWKKRYLKQMTRHVKKLKKERRRLKKRLRAL